jgi:hypothetical protein
VAGRLLGSPVRKPAPPAQAIVLLLHQPTSSEDSMKTNSFLLVKRITLPCNVQAKVLKSTLGYALLLEWQSMDGSEHICFSRFGRQYSAAKIVEVLLSRGLSFKMDELSYLTGRLESLAEMFSVRVESCR